MMMTKILCTFLVLSVALSASGFVKKGQSGKTLQTDGSQADVQRAIDASSAGGTVTIPAGTFDWSGTLTITKAVSLAGQGSRETIIRNQNGNSSLIAAASGKDGNITIYAIGFKQIADNGNNRGFCITARRDASTAYTVLVHDCRFEEGTVYNYSMQITANGIIVWSCQFVGSGPLGMGGITLDLGQQDYESYNQASTLGTKDPDGLHNSYVEDCEFLDATNMANFDASSRTVWRHNMHQDAGLGSHGFETSPIGVAAWEIYDNVFKCNRENSFYLDYYVHIRGGTGVFTGNSLEEIPWGKTHYKLTVFSVTRSANDGHGSSVCPVEYPAPRQTGWAWANNGANWGKVEGQAAVLEGGQSPGYFLPFGKGAVSDPIYIWGDSGAGAVSPVYVGIQTYAPDDCGNGEQVEPKYLQKGRDYFVNSGPKPGWQAYPYPHPMRSGGGPQPTPTPPGPTPTPQPTPTPPGPTPTPTAQPTPTPPGQHKHQILMESDTPMYMTPLPQK